MICLFLPAERAGARVAHWAARAVGVAGVVVVVLTLLLAAPAAAGQGHVPSTASEPVGCAEDVLACDSDGDGVADVVEEAICGSATCATGTEDADGTGVPDAEELTASLERGGPGGPVQFRDAGMVRIVLAGPTVIDVPWWPVVVLAAGVVVFGVVVVVRRRAGARQADGNGE